MVILCGNHKVLTNVFFISIGSSKRKSYDLRKLTSDDGYNIIDEIPSDNESEVSMSDETEELEMINQPELFNIEHVEQNERDFIESENSNDESDEIEPSNIVPSNKDDVWTSDVTNCTKPNLFAESTGPNINESAEFPVDVFLQLYPLDFLEHLVFQTNLYALQKKGGNQNSFVPTTVAEMKAFLGLNILMGIKKLPSYKDYWSSQLELRDTYISSVIPRDRFVWFLSNLHVNDNERQPRKQDQDFDKLYKVRPMLTKLSETFLQSMKPHENQSIDESMIRFKGRSSIRQYMPLKPVKRGYKVWIRADSTGYVCEFEIYTGKVNNTSEENLGHRVITTLTRNIVGKYHKVYFDNFFNSKQLQIDLLAKGIYACGTVRKHRKGIPDMKANKMNRGDFDWLVSKGGIVHVKWMDRKPVLFLGNFHNPMEIQTVGRRKKDGTRVNIVCPNMVKDYNCHMGYVDKFDMLRSIYEIDRKSQKWWHRIFFYFLDVAVVNSYIIFQERFDSNMHLKAFRLAVAVGLIGAHPTRAKRTRKRSGHLVNAFKVKVPLEVRYDRNAHMPMRSTSVRCALCSTRREPHRTLWKCSTCNVGLCLSHNRNCFSVYHTK